MDSLWLAEKSAVVLDFGARFVKFGVAGDHEPRFSAPPTPLSPRSTTASSRKTARGKSLADIKRVAGLAQPSRRDDETGVACASGRRVPEGEFEVEGIVQQSVDQHERQLSQRRWENVLQEYLHHLYHVQLGVTARERPVIFCEPFLSIRPFKMALVKCLFEHLEVPSISFLPTLVSPLYCLGIQTGLVVDVGYTGCRVLPICFGVPLYEAYTDCNTIGGKSVDDELFTLILISNARRARSNLGSNEESVIPHLSSKDLAALLTPAVLEDIKVRALYVRYCRPGNGSKLSFFESSSAVSYSIDGDERTTIAVEPRDRWAACEVLFGGGGEPDCEASIQNVICEALERCPVDSRRLVVQNILLCGGSTLLKGFLSRLAQELSAELKSRRKLAALERYVNFGLPPFSPITRPWVGASVFGSLEGIKSYTREEYLRGAAIPDWTNWADNTIYNTSKPISSENASSLSMTMKSPHSVEEEDQGKFFWKSDETRKDGTFSAVMWHDGAAFHVPDDSNN